MPIVFASGETVGRLRFSGVLTRFPDHVLYRGFDETKRRPVLIRQYIPDDLQRATEALPAGGRYAVSRWNDLVTLQQQRFDLARRVLPKAGAACAAILEGIVDDTFYGLMSHPASETLTAGFGEIHAPSEPALQQLLVPILDLLEVLHDENVLYGPLSPEEILIDHTGSAGLGRPVLAGFGSVYQWRGMGPARPRPDASPGWAPEHHDRQASLSGASDVYALGALAYRLMTGHSIANAADRRRGQEHTSIFEAAPGYSVGLKRAVDQALRVDVGARLKTVSAFRGLSMPGVVALAPAPERKRDKAAPGPVPAAASPPAPVRKRESIVVPQPAPIPVPVPVPAPAPVVEPEPEPGLQDLPVAAREEAVEAPRRPQSNPWSAVGKAAGASRRTARAAASALTWTQPGIELARRQWQPLVAAALALGLASAVWWLKSEQVWPRGPYETASGPPAPVTTSPVTEPSADKTVAPSATSPTTSTLAQPAKPKTEEAAGLAETPPKPTAAIVKSVQVELKRLGFFQGPIDGEDGLGLHAAIASAEAKLGGTLPLIPSKALLAWLKAQPSPEAARSAPPSPAPAPTTARSETPASNQVDAKPRNLVGPKYPRFAEQRGIEGWIDVVFDVDPSGHVQNVIVSGASSEDADRYFSNEAVRAARNSTYFPSLVDGKPDWTRAKTQHYVFKLNDR